MGEEKTTPETEKKPDRPDRSQLNAFENFYENFRKVPLKYIDIFIGVCVAALVIVVLVGILKSKAIIRNNVDKQVNILISDAKAEAAKLEADGEGEYMRLLAEAYNTADKQDFYEFTQALEALKSSLTGDEKTVILDADSALGKILMGAYGN